MAPFQYAFSSLPLSLLPLPSACKSRPANNSTAVMGVILFKVPLGRLGLLLGTAVTTVTWVFGSAVGTIALLLSLTCLLLPPPLFLSTFSTLLIKYATLWWALGWPRCCNLLNAFIETHHRLSTWISHTLAACAPCFPVWFLLLYICSYITWLAMIGCWQTC